MRNALAEARVAPQRGRLHQRPRLLHAAQRPDRDRRRSSRSSATHAYRVAAQRDQGVLRPRARRERRHRGGDLRAGQRGAAGCRPRSTSRRPTPPAICRTSIGRGPRPGARRLLSNSFGFGGINAALVFRRAGDRLDSPPSLRRSHHKGSPMSSLLRRSLAEAAGYLRAGVHRRRLVVAAKYYPDANYGVFGIATGPRDGPVGHDHRHDGHLRRPPEPRRHHRPAGRAADRRSRPPWPTSSRSWLGAVLAALARQGALPARRHPPDRAGHAGDREQHPARPGDRASRRS